MFGSFRLRSLLPLGVLALAMLLGGCVYAPYPGYGYYGGGYSGGGPYYGGGVVAFGGGGGWYGHDGWHGGWHHRGWYR
jgi:hypothetical protein